MRIGLVKTESTIIGNIAYGLVLLDDITPAPTIPRFQAQIDCFINQ